MERNLDIIKNSTGSYVVMEFGGNDCDFNWKEISENPDAEHKPNSEIKHFVMMYTELIKEIKDMGKMPVLLSLPPIDAKKYFLKISNGLNAENILKWMNGNKQFLSNLLGYFKNFMNIMKCSIIKFLVYNYFLGGIEREREKWSINFLI